MRDDARKSEVDELRKEIEATWDAAYRRMLTLQADIDRLKLELEALRKALEERSPGLEERYALILEDTLEKTPPE